MISNIKKILRESLDADKEHEKELAKTGFWGKAGAGALIVAKSTGRFLIPKRSDEVEQPNTWGVWGGAIDGGKTPVQAVQQEVEEECGYRGHMELYPLYVFKDARSGFQYFNFLAVVDDEFDPILNWETSNFGWFTLDNLPSPLHFGVKALLNDPKSMETITKFTKQLSEQNTIKKILRESVDKTITCEKCGWHWKESESSKAEMYKCHKCGHDNTPDLNEHLQQAEKTYFNIGKLSPNDKESILRITNGDAYTKTISDIYFGLSNGSADNLTNYGLKELYNTYLQLKNYNKNVFPIKDFNILLKENPVELSYALKSRQQILDELKKLPSIAVRNLKEEIRIPRTKGQLDDYQNGLEYFLNYFSLLSNRDEKIQRVILNKMFKSGSTLESWLDFIQEKENIIGGVNFTKNIVRNIVRDSYNGDLDIIYNQGNVIVVEVSSPYGIKEIGCNSVWCFTYGDSNWHQWNTYSTNGLAYVIFDFSKSTDSPDFMYVLIRPLPEKPLNYDDDNYDPHESPLYDMTNEPEEHPEYVIDNLIGLDKAKKILTFGIEPKPEPKPKPRPFVDPNQLSLFEGLKTRLTEKLVLKSWGDYAKLVTKAYAEAPEYEPEAVKHWNALNQSNYTLFKRLLSKINILFVTIDKSNIGSINILGRDYKIIYQAGEPYSSQSEMKADLQKTGTLKINIDYSEHPVFSVKDNIVFRTVHDYIVHILGNKQFGAQGEIASYNLHAKLVPKEAIPAIFTEVVGQACTRVITGSFPIQKIAILKGFDYLNVGKVEDYDIKDKELSLFESLRRKVLKEYLSQDMVSLKKYFETTKEEREHYLPYSYPEQFKQFAIEQRLNSKLVKELTDMEPYEIPELLQQNYPEIFQQFGSWLYMMIEDGDLNAISADYPAWSYFDSVQLIKNQWLIHFTNDADSIAREGFTRGVNEMDKLDLTTHLGDFYKKYGGYNFAYTIQDYKKHSGTRYLQQKFKYGNEAVIFNASGLRLWHHGDEEPQVIFFGNTAKNIIPITGGEDKDWAVRNSKTNRIIFEDDNFDKVVQWVINNFIQYRNAI